MAVPIAHTARRWMAGNAHEHSDDVGHKPYQPNDRAERVEALSRLLAAAKIGDGGPHRMHDHERDSKRACDAVDAEAGHIRLAGDVTHDEGARCVAGQAGPKQEDIFQAERSVATLAEYAPRVKKQGQGDGHGGDDELDRHEIPFVDGAPGLYACTGNVDKFMLREAPHDQPHN